jgi:hypothetical protein
MTRPKKFTRFEMAPSTIKFEPVVNEEAGLARPVVLQRATTERPASEKSFLYDKHFFPLKRSKLVTFGVEKVRLVGRRIA